MNNSRLLKIFNALEHTEITLFTEFVRAKFYDDKKPEELIKLLDLLLKQYRKPSHPDLSKKNIYQQLYGPDKEWIPGKLDKLMSRFLKVMYQFISLYLNEQPFNYYQSICNFLQKRNLKPIFDRVFNKWSKEVEKHQFADSGFFYERFILKELLVRQQAIVITPNIDLTLPHMLENFDQYYFLTKLQYACQLMAINIFNHPVEVKNSLKSLEYLDQLIELPHLQIPIIKVYYKAFKMLNSEENFRTENFERFKSLLFEYDDQLSIEQQKSLHTLIRNYAILQYHNGSEKYLRIAFDIYKNHLKKGFLYYKNEILTQPFLNIVTFGLRLKEFDWIYHFIQNHKNKIASSEPNNRIYHFNLAKYYLYTKEYDKALEYLPNHFDGLYYKIETKRLELIIYQETDSEILDAKIDAFKIFIYRIPKSKITQKQKKANNNFIHLLKQIRHPKTAVSPSRIEKLKSKLLQMNHIADKQWLLGCLERIEKP